jgi:hypothetical protein
MKPEALRFVTVLKKKLDEYNTEWSSQYRSSATADGSALPPHPDMAEHV